MKIGDRVCLTLQPDNTGTIIDYKYPLFLIQFDSGHKDIVLECFLNLVDIKSNKD